MRQFKRFVAGFAVLVAGLSGWVSAVEAAAAQPIKNQYIVTLAPPAVAMPGALADVAQQAQGLLAQVGGGTVLATYTHALRGFSVRMSAVRADVLSRLPGVLRIEQDQWIHATATQTGATWGLDRIDQHNLPLNGTYVYQDSAGAGVHVYVIDTGLNANHVDFTGRVSAGRNFAPNSSGSLLCQLLGLGCPAADPANTTDCNGHGTHVSGTAAGTTWGVAKKATVHPVRVLGCTGSGSNSGVIAGIDWVAANAQLPAVANMSLGGGDSAALDQAVQNAIASGVTFAVAAGNDNANACSGSPNKVPEAITVGATTSSDARSSFSNFGACVDVFAPGSAITSAWYTSNTATNTIDGTSMASPHVAGAAALVLGVNPSATPEQVTDAIVGSATLGALSNVGSGSPNALLYTGD
ncbi:MAG: S8 family peptidase [Sinimarinibacterium sp.]|jgi:subtilisin family serine protease